MVRGGVDVLLAGSGLRAERVEQTAGQAVNHRLIADIATGDAGDDFVLVVRGADVVIPAANQTIEAQQKALAGVLVFRFTRAGSGFTPVHIDRLRRVEGEIGRRRGDAVAGVVRRRGIQAQTSQWRRADGDGVVVARPEIFKVGVVIIAELGSGLAEERGLLGLWHQVDEFTGAEAAQAVAGDQVGAVAVAVGQRVGGVAVLAVVAGERGAGGLIETATGRVVGGEGAVVGVEVLLLVVVEHAEDVEAVFFQIAVAPTGAHVLGRAATAVGRRFAAQGQGAIGKGFLGDEVDHTADGVGAVQGRGAVAQHFHALDGGKRDHVQVHRAAGRVGPRQGIVGQASTVEQHQRLVRADAAHVGKRRTASGRADGAGAVVDRLTASDALDQFGSGGHALFAQLVSLEDGDRHRRFRIDPANRRTGHFDPLQLRGRRRHDSGCRRGAVVVLGRLHGPGAHPHGHQIQRNETVARHRCHQRFEREAWSVHQHGCFRFSDVIELAL